MKQYSSIKPLVIARYQECGNIAQTARDFEINKKTVRAWLLKAGIQIRPTNIDIMGMRFGRLRVIGCVGKDKNHKYIWQCECDCGNETQVRANDLRQEKIKSCGCLHRETSSKNGRAGLGRQGNRKKFVGEMSGVYYSQLRHNAITRKHDFFVSKEYLWNLFLQQEKKCAISGMDLIINKTASVDRIDSSKGYIEGNVQWLHKHINRMKLDHDQDYFLSLCSLIHNHNQI